LTSPVLKVIFFNQSSNHQLTLILFRLHGWRFSLSQRRVYSRL